MYLIKHFFFFCPTYRAQRTLLLTSIAQHLDLELDIILHGIQTRLGRTYLINLMLRGDDSYDLQHNIDTFKLVQTYISESNRF